jgi:hypothetical protein
MCCGQIKSRAMNEVDDFVEHGLFVISFFVLLSCHLLSFGSFTAQ